MLFATTGIDTLDTNLVESLELRHVEVYLINIEVIILSKSIRDNCHILSQLLIVSSLKGQRADFLFNINKELEAQLTGQQAITFSIDNRNAEGHNGTVLRISDLSDSRISRYSSLLNHFSQYWIKESIIIILASQYTDNFAFSGIRFFFGIIGEYSISTIEGIYRTIGAILAHILHCRECH